MKHEAEKLTEQERALLALFRQMDERGKHHVLLAARAVAWFRAPQRL